jgi:biotin operon repressor
LLVILPTVFSVDVLMIIEILRKWGDKVEQYNKKGY